jgi:hypothetical protein
MVCILVIIYFVFQWNFLIQFVTSALSKIFSFTSSSSILFTQNGESCLLVNGNLFIITRACTYIDLALTVAPLCWRLNNSIFRNLSVILLITFLILLMNIIRISGTVYFYLEGASWELIHHIPDISLRLIIVAISAFSALKADLALPEKIKIA